MPLSVSQNSAVHSCILFLCIFPWEMGNGHECIAVWDPWVSDQLLPIIRQVGLCLEVEPTVHWLLAIVFQLTCGCEWERGWYSEMFNRRGRQQLQESLAFCLRYGIAKYLPALTLIFLQVRPPQWAIYHLLALSPSLSCWSPSKVEGCTKPPAKLSYIVYIKSANMIHIFYRSLSTRETFDITDKSLATQGPSLPTFLIAQCCDVCNCWATWATHWPKPLSSLPEVDVGIEDHDGHGGQHQKASIPSPLLFLPQVLLLVGVSGGDHGHHHWNHLPWLNLVC